MALQKKCCTHRRLRYIDRMNNDGIARASEWVEKNGKLWLDGVDEILKKKGMRNLQNRKQFRKQGIIRVKATIGISWKIMLSFSYYMHILSFFNCYSLFVFFMMLFSLKKNSTICVYVSMYVCNYACMHACIQGTGTLGLPTQHFCSADKHFWRMIDELAMYPVNFHGFQSTMNSQVNYHDTGYFVKFFNKDVQYLRHSLNL